MIQDFIWGEIACFSLGWVNGARY